MRKRILVGLGSALALVAVSATDASAGCRRARACGGCGPALAYRYAPPPVFYRAPAVAYYTARVPAGYPYSPYYYGYGYGGCDRGYGAYGYAPPVVYYDGFRPATGWVRIR